MATAQSDGIVRTESGRQTYAADGLATSNPMASNAQRASELSDSSTIGDKDASDGEKHRSDSNGNDNQDDDVEKQSSNEKKDGDDEEKDPNIVDWDGDDDPQNPYNWKPLRKWSIAVCMGLMTFVCTFASSVLSSAVMPISMEYGVGSTVAILSTSLFVLGFAFGPIIVSILYGQRGVLNRLVVSECGHAEACCWMRSRVFRGLKKIIVLTMSFVVGTIQ